MKKSIRSTRFTLGMVLFLIIILLLSVLSNFYLNKLSRKTGAILKENHNSVVFARDMSEDMTMINHEITCSFLENKNPDILIIDNELKLFVKSLQLEKNNITEIGEDKLVSDIETNFTDFSKSVNEFVRSPKQVDRILSLQKKFENLYQQLSLLSQINGKAIEEKTDDAKVSAKKAAVNMSFIAALCFLIAYGFTFSFSSYYNERFYQMYNGIKEMFSGNYSQRLEFNGQDEIHEISSIINKMADALANNYKRKELSLQEDRGTLYNSNDFQELKDILSYTKNIEKQTHALISKFEKKNRE
jgi:two-component system, NtrC family, sensor histidine kinase KinB